MKKILILIFTFFGFSNTFSQAPTNGLVAYYPFNGNANDESGNNNNGILHGALTFNNGPKNQALTVQKQAGQYISVNNSSSLNNVTQHTISIWVKPENFDLNCWNEREMLVGKGQDLITNSFGLSISRNTTAGCGNASSFTNYRFTLENGGQNLQTPIYPVDGKWVNVIGTYDGNTAKLFLNGVKISESTIGLVNISNTNPIYFNYATWYGGQGVTNGRYGGGIDEVRIYNRAINASEAFSIYNDNTLPIDLTNGLVAHYKFEENFLDETQNQNNGTQNGEVVFAIDRHGTGKALKFDGIDDVIVVPHKPILQFPNLNKTVSIWTNISSLDPTLYHQFLKKGSMSPDLFMYFDYTGTNSSIFNGDLINPKTELNGWVNLVYTVNNNKATYFINGNKVCYVYYPYPCDYNLYTNFPNLSNEPLEIGKGFYFFKGLLDDVRIYNRALSEIEVGKLFASESIAPTIYQQTNPTSIVKGNSLKIQFKAKTGN